MAEILENNQEVKNHCYSILEDNYVLTFRYVFFYSLNFFLVFIQFYKWISPT